MKTYFWNKLSEVEKQKVLLRPSLPDHGDFLKKTQNIIDQVKLNRDQALFELTKKYDRAELNTLRVSAEEMTAAFKAISKEARAAIDFAYTQIETNHSAQLPRNQTVKTCEGVFCERQPRPLERIGLYIPGGTAPLVSTALMLGVPAQIAGCRLRILCTPPNQQGEIDPHLLVVAELCGIDFICKVGGAQAIAAMAYGTETIPKVDKIFGPGNSWVTQAKILVAQDPKGASIDMPAGPSEVMVIADDAADPDYVASDLLSQAEHGTDSQVILVALSEEFAVRVEQAIQRQADVLPRRDIVKQSLVHSRILIANNVEQAILISNLYAPEHLILQIINSEKYSALIQNAGAVFLGAWTPEAVGDYVTGSNHVLPTYGYARNHSGLSLTDFMKFISFQKVTKEGLEKIGPFAEKLAEIEGLQAHKRAVSLRLAEMVISDE